MSQLRLFNTLTKKLEDFQPLKPGKVSVYHCGPTVYWVQHIGNIRAMTMADLVRRSLIYLGFDVNFARNYTDVGHLTGDNIGDADSGEDRMEKGAKREGLTPEEIADKYIAIFEKDTRALNILPPDFQPRATDYISEMQDMVSVLLAKGYAYTTDKAVYFDIEKAEDYTRLSGQKLENNRIGEGHGKVQDGEKRNPQDFALWFFKTGEHKNALQTWESPFASGGVENGRGFPGWHIECSAMAKAELGERVDIHMGGVEHIPVHHTNEIAQSESANGVRFVNYWLHNEWLTINGEKISKSEGNIFTVAELIAEKHDPLALRYLFLGAHYRSQQNFTLDSLSSSERALNNLREALLKIAQNQPEILLKDKVNAGSVLEIWHARFVKEITDDINISAALAVVWQLLKNTEVDDADKFATIIDFDRVLGLDLLGYIKSALQNNSSTKLSPEELTKVNELISARKIARSEKNWPKADEIRLLLETKYGLTIKDIGEETTF